LHFVFEVRLFKYEYCTYQNDEKEFEDLTSLRLCVLKEYLETIFYSDFLLKHKEKGFELLTELQKEGKGYASFHCNLTTNLSNPESTCFMYFNTQELFFFENCFKYLNGEEKLENCFQKRHFEELSDIVLNVIFHKNVDHLKNKKKKEIKEIQNYVLKCFENFLNVDDLNKQKRDFIRKLFSNDKEKLKKVAPKIFEDKEDKDDKGKKEIEE